jgi:arylsulfatase A-like enzyme
MLWLGACAAPNPLPPPEAPPMSVLLLMTDDQRHDTLWAMPELEARLGAEGVRFTNAVVSTPMCCPSRTSLLSGGWTPSNVGVTANELPNGGATLFSDEDTVGVRLNGAGVATGLVGKYLNDYGAMGAYVPPGWSTFAGVSAPGDWSAWTRVVGGDGDGGLVEEAGYLTDSDVARAQEFLVAHAEHDFFLQVSFAAPHYPWVPDAADETAHSDHIWRPPSYNEADVSDKPAWIQATAPENADSMSAHDEDVRDQLRTLAAVDRGVAELLDTLDALGRADDTIVVFTSDNGMLWGEHRAWGKGLPYLESVRVPLLVRIPGVDPRTEDTLVAANLDLGEALSARAGRPGEGQGIDLFAVAAGAEGGREVVLMEGDADGSAPWSAYLTAREAWIDWMSGETERYDLVADPDQLDADTVAPDPDLVARMHDQRGLRLAVAVLDVGAVGLPYTARLRTWGGTEPISFALVEGALPDGITLGADGTLTGTPTAEGRATFSVRVQDASTNTYTGAPQQDTRGFVLDVGTVEAAPVVAIVAGGVRVTGLRGRIAFSRDRSFEAPLARAGDGVLALHPGPWWWRAERDGAVLARGTAYVR